MGLSRFVAMPTAGVDDGGDTQLAAGTQRSSWQPKRSDVRTRRLPLTTVPGLVLLPLVTRVPAMNASAPQLGSKPPCDDCLCS